VRVCDVRIGKASTACWSTQRLVWRRRRQRSQLACDGDDHGLFGTVEMRYQLGDYAENM
jgi:hypothetical protein